MLDRKIWLFLWCLLFLNSGVNTLLNFIAFDPIFVHLQHVNINVFISNCHSKISKELTTYEVKKEARSKSKIQVVPESNGIKGNLCEICRRTEFKEPTEGKPCKYCKMNVCENCGEQMKLPALVKVRSLCFDNYQFIFIDKKAIL